MDPLLDAIVQRLWQAIDERDSLPTAPPEDAIVVQHMLDVRDRDRVTLKLEGWARGFGNALIITRGGEGLPHYVNVWTRR